MAPLTAAEKMRRYREKRKLDPVREQAYKEKEKARSLARKKVKDMTKKEHNIMKKKWKKWDKNRRIREKTARTLLDDTPPLSPCGNNVPIYHHVCPESSGNQRRGRKVVLKNRSKVVRENHSLKKEKKKAEQEACKWRRKFWREKKKLQRLVNSSCSSNPRVEESPLSKARRSLTFDNAISNSQLKNLEKKGVVKALAFQDIFLPLLKPVAKKHSDISRVLVCDYIKKRRLSHYCSRALGYAAKVRLVRKHKLRSSVFKNLVTEFFLCDDVSRTTSGIKETITKCKSKKQKRYLLSSMKKLHTKFCRVHNSTVSYSTFTRYRPFYVVPMKEAERNTCLCKIHSNFNMMVQKLKNLGLVDSYDAHELVKRTACVATFKCMSGKCIDCRSNIFTFHLNEDQTNHEVEWEQWTTVKEMRQKNNKSYELKVVRKVKTKGTIQDLILKFQESIPRFKQHIFSIKAQHNAYNLCRSSLDCRTALIHVDFSENFSCKLHEEIQSFHFGSSRNQVTLHTGMLYLFNDQEHKIPFCSVSPSTEHGPQAIWAHLHPILTMLKESYPSVETVHFFSDGPATHYRQKKHFYIFSSRFYSYGFKTATWSFFESSHGKGAPDGVGGALKRTANKLVAQGLDIPDAQTFYNVMKNHSKIKLFYVPQANVLEIEKLIPTNIQPIPGTQKIHQLALVDGSLMHREQSCFCEINEWKKHQFCSCYGFPKYDTLVKDVGAISESVNEEFDTSEDDSENYSVHDDSASDMELETICNPTDFNEPILQEVVLSRIKLGTHVLIQFIGGHRKSTKFRYVGVCQDDFDNEEGEVNVMFYKVAGEDGSLFTLDSNDIADVEFNQILGILPNPTMIVKGSRQVFYKFPASIDVHEQ